MSILNAILNSRRFSSPAACWGIAILGLAGYVGAIAYLSFDGYGQDEAAPAPYAIICEDSK